MAFLRTDAPPKLSRGLAWSLGLHGSLALLILIKSVVFPSTPIPYIPSLRVDLVGLPEILKKDLNKVKIPEYKEPSTEKESAPNRSGETLEEPVSREELILNPKKSGIHSPKTKPSKNQKSKDRANKALARIKALNRISESLEEVETPAVKGNIVSKGATLTGNAKENAQSQYYDEVLSRVQDFWELPIWLSRQNLSAQVQIMIDSRGRLRNLRFIKPSGNEAFDNAVRRCLQSSEPFPFPPEALQNQLLTHGILLGFPL